MLALRNKQQEGAAVLFCDAQLLQPRQQHVWVARHPPQQARRAQQVVPRLRCCRQPLRPRALHDVVLRVVRKRGQVCSGGMPNRQGPGRLVQRCAKVGEECQLAAWHYQT